MWVIDIGWHATIDIFIIAIICCNHRIPSPGTYDILYDDGEKEMGISADLIKTKEGGRKKRLFPLPTFPPVRPPPPSIRSFFLRQILLHVSSPEGRSPQLYYPLHYHARLLCCCL
jgi:hypothetical protein